MQLGFLIPIVSGIHDSLSSIPDSKDQDSRFHGKNLLDSMNPDSLKVMLHETIRNDDF